MELVFINRQPRFILASASPRRRQILNQIGLRFEVCPSNVREESLNLSHLPPDALVQTLALAKAQDVARLRAEAGVIVIGADTVVAVDGAVLGKPKDAAEARHMLELLSGKKHEVYTGVALVQHNGRQLSAAARTEVWMRPLTSTWITTYIETGEPLDKAGAYAVQGLGSVMIEKIHGCYFNVVGLPVSTLVTMLQEWGIDLPSYWRITKVSSP